MSHFIVTAGADELDVGSPRPSHITAYSIAWSLSQINRFTGHALRPYSVAEHSLLVCDIAEQLGLGVHGQLAALMQDAHKSITGELNTPGKHQVGSAWRRWEDSMQRAVLRAFGILTPYQVHAANIRQAKLIALATERRDLMPKTPSDWPALKGIEPLATVDLYSRERVAADWETWRDCWLDRYHGLKSRLHTTRIGRSLHDPVSTDRLAHEWDDDACCIHCGLDGAEVAHLVKVAGYEQTDNDRWCDARESKHRQQHSAMQGERP